MLNEIKMKVICLYSNQVITELSITQKAPLDPLLVSFHLLQKWQQWPRVTYAQTLVGFVCSRPCISGIPWHMPCPACYRLSTIVKLIQLRYVSMIHLYGSRSFTV